MAKRVDPLKAKQAKQKKIAIGLCVFLAIVLFIQVPRTMKMLKGPQAATTAAPVETTPAAPAAAAPGTSGEGIPVPAAPGTPAAAPAAGTPAAAAPQTAVLVDSDVPAAAGEGQLRSFELFKAKDPFAAQDVPAASTASAGGEAPAPADGGSNSKPAPAKPADGTVIAPSSGAAPPTSGPTATPPAADATPTAPATAPAAAPAAAPATTTSISVNGVAENVAIEGTFPAEEPVFVLVSTATDGKSVQIGVAGGTYADGAETIKLTIGKELKLRNTADGSEYVLLLETVAGFVPPKKK